MSKKKLVQYVDRESHIHVSLSQVNRRIELDKEFWKSRKKSQILPEKPPRVHLDGWPNRPKPEKPERGRNSQRPNRRKKFPRGKVLGDLITFEDTTYIHLHTNKVDELEVSVSYFENLQGYVPNRGYPYPTHYACLYVNKCLAASAGPYLYLGLSRVSESCEDRFHKLLLGQQVIEVEEKLLNKMNIVSRIDKAY